MSSKGMTSPEAAARLVFAPEEEIPASVPSAMRAKSIVKRHQTQAPIAYDARFVKVSSVNTPAADWRRAFDFSWLLGRATA